MHAINYIRSICRPYRIGCGLLLHMCLSVRSVSPAITAERIEMPFGPVASPNGISIRSAVIALVGF